MTTIQNSGECTKVFVLEVDVHSGHSGEQCAGEQQDRREREDLHDLVCSVFGSDDQDVERACDAVPGVAGGGERGVDPCGECDEPLGRSLRGERVELGVAQSREHLSVGRERPSQSTDSTASGAESRISSSGSLLGFASAFTSNSSSDLFDLSKAWR